MCLFILMPVGGLPMSNPKWKEDRFHYQWISCQCWQNAGAHEVNAVCVFVCVWCVRSCDWMSGWVSVGKREEEEGHSTEAHLFLVVYFNHLLPSFQ